MKSLSFSVVMTICMAIAGQPARAAESVSNEQVRQVAARSLSYLSTDALKWREEHNCQACHHGSLYLWSNHVARQQGYAVDEAALTELTCWVIGREVDRVTPDMPTQPECTGCRTSGAAKPLISSVTTTPKANASAKKPRLSLNSIYLLNALNAISQPDETVQHAKHKLVDHLVATQSEEGSWTGPSGRPPLFVTTTETTLLASRALSATSVTAPQSAATNLRAKSWIMNHREDSSLQAVDYRLLWTTQQAHQDVSRAKSLVERLRQQQQTDGGWSQDQKGASDAYATGQALVALHAAGVSVADPIVQRGLSFLMTTQRADGTWPMTSRPDPQDGQPAENLNPITYAATAWATLALVEFVPAR